MFARKCQTSSTPALKVKVLGFDLARKLNFQKSLGCVSLVLLLMLIGCQSMQTFAQTCSMAPADLVSWYQGENNTIDFINTNNGTIQGNVTYSTGYVGQTFTLGGAGNTSGSGDRVLVGNPANLQLQDFTIEGWIKRSSNTIVTNSPVAGFEGGSFFAYGAGGYGFVIQQSTNRLGLTKIGTSAVYSTTATISDTNFHHVAVTKLGNQITFYVDGVADTPITYNTTFTFGTNAAIGARGDNDARNAFFGSIDELSIYSRSLAASEIQAIVAAASAGKCFMPNTFTVTNTNDSGAGSLRQAILDANAATGADAIKFDTGVFSTPQIITLTSGDIVFANSVDATATVIGPGSGLLTISGNNASKIFSVTETPVVSISGMTLTGGNGVGVSPGNTFGGAVYNQGVLTLTNMVITGNSAASDGGGVYNSTSDSMTLISCNITNNSAASQSGGAHNHTNATMTITDSTISNNTASGSGSSNGGGGIYSEDGSTLSMTNTIISGNTAPASNGGGILADSVTVTLTNSTISDNSTGGVGGGIAFDVDSPTTITGSTISGNTAAVRGGGIDLQPDSNTFVTIANSTVSGNTSANGGGIFRVASPTLTVTLSYTTVANNTATSTGGGMNGTFNLGSTIVGNNSAATEPDYSGTLNSTTGYNLIENITGPTFTGTVTGNITGLDPLLDSLANNGGPTFTHRLLGSSPAIDAADPVTFPATDQRGILRPTGVRADIGAFERLAPSAASVSISGRVSNGRSGIANAVVSLIDPMGSTHIARTNGFGQFRFERIEVSQTYIVTINAKGYIFEPQAISVFDEIDDLELFPASK
jgi:hypothetical protein